jgi:hypothetical protein
MLETEKARDLTPQLRKRAKHVQRAGTQFTLESHEAVGILLHILGQNVAAEYVPTFPPAKQRRYLPT